MTRGAQRERELFIRLADLDNSEDRQRMLNEACADDPVLRVRLEEMLRLRDAADSFFDRTEMGELGAEVWGESGLGPGEGDLKEEAIGTWIGRYRLLAVLGKGGFGVVYRAEQSEPVRRQVALKIIKAGMDTREVIARFELERQALALMDHPNVAHVLDAGSTENGRPFFVMDLVAGVPITQYCADHRLSVRKRLELFTSVCNAVQHAHQKGIIHRDLKPSNILVSTIEEQPCAKVIDFGIAKAIQDSSEAEFSLTHVGQLVGTPAYMSPEQADSRGADIDTRSDIYSLGVVLYELLVGCAPFDPKRLRHTRPVEMIRILREEEPPSPSARLRALAGVEDSVRIAAERSTSKRRLITVIRRDLDWVVGKAMAKDRARRYETANALAQDLWRYLRGEPVAASPPGMLYRISKLTWRHRQAVATVVMVFVSLVVGLLFTSYAFIEARDQALRARQVAYAADMKLTQHALEVSNLGRAVRLLNRQVPGRGQRDLRGWEWRFLWQESWSDSIGLIGDQGAAVTSLSLSADGRWLVTGGMEDTVRLWDLAGPRCVLTLPGGGQVAGFSPDGSTFAAASADGGVTRYRVPSGEKLTHWVTPPSSRLVNLRYAPSGDWLAGYGTDGVFYLWDVKTQALRVRLANLPTVGIHSGEIAFSGLNNQVVLGDGTGRVRVLEAESGRVQREWQAHTNAVTALALSPDDRFLATASGYSERNIKVFDFETGLLSDLLEGHQAWISSLAFDSTGQRLASASADQTIRVWNLGRLRAPVVLRGHQQEVWGVAFLPDSATLVSGGKGGEIRLWDTSLPADVGYPIVLPLRPGTFSPDGSWLLTLDEEGQLTRYASTDPEPEAWPEVSEGVNTTLAVSPKRGLLALVNRAGGVHLWRWNPLEKLTTLQGHAEAGRVEVVRFSPDGRYLVCRDDLAQIRVFDTDRWIELAAWPLKERGAAPFSISPDGAFLALGGDGVLILDLLSGRPVHHLAAHKQPTDAVAFSPDGRFLASGSQEGVARLWEVSSWELTTTLQGHLLGVHSLAFSADGRRLATGSVGAEAVRLWDLSTYEEVLTIPLVGGVVNRLEFAPDGNALLAEQARLWLWSVPSWEEIELPP